MNTRNLFTALVFACAALQARADQIIGRVVHVADGDTITVLDADNTQHRIRLAGIDAPEKKQPFGGASGKSLAELVAGQTVVVDWKKLDRYERVVGQVLLGGRDMNLVQVQRGLAWFYVAYQREQSPADRVAYANAEREAREQRRGLWFDPNPVAPWEWRANIKRKLPDAVPNSD